MSLLRVRKPHFNGTSIGLAVLAGLVSAFIMVSSTRARPVAPELPSRWVFTLPDGDPAAGEQAFIKMQCFSCHKVTGKTFTNTDVQTGSIGPEFTPGYAKLPAGYLAESIINFDRFIPHANFRVSYMSPAAFKPSGVEYPTNSRMANYNEIMTIQEMIDIVAFLKNIGQVAPQ